MTPKPEKDWMQKIYKELVNRGFNVTFGAIETALNLAKERFREDVLFPEVKKLRKSIRYWGLKHDRKVYAYKKLEKQIAQLKADRQRMIERIGELEKIKYNERGYAKARIIVNELKSLLEGKEARQ